MSNCAVTNGRLARERLVDRSHRPHADAVEQSSRALTEDRPSNGSPSPTRPLSGRDGPLPRLRS